MFSFSNQKYYKLSLYLILFLPVSTIAGQYETTIQKAYLAYYSRPADPAGLDYWEAKIAEQGGNISAIIDDFGHSPEYTQQAVSLSNEELINKIYISLFNRDADSAGLNYYVNLLTSGQLSLARIALSILDGASNDDQTIISQKLEVARFYTDQSRSGIINYNSNQAINIIADITDDSASVTTATQRIDAIPYDTAAPTITLNGDYSQSVLIDTEYNERGAVATDDIDGDVKVEISGSVNTTATGSYPVRYVATDSKGNSSTLYRNVVVETWYDDLFPYQSSRYSPKLKQCVIAPYTNSCTMTTLPFIGQETATPSLDDIMDRVIVSHDWMGDRFKQILPELPDDILPLLRSVTAIVIDDNVRPSYYRASTGAIYLDPANIWLTNSEKDDIAKDEDYRTSFGNELAFKEYWTYSKDNKYAFGYNNGTLYNEIERSLDDIKIRFARLMYHELSHANDYAPYSAQLDFDRTDPVYEAISAYYSAEKMYSQQLDRLNPLTSDALDSLAKVRFRGEDPSAEEKNMSAAYVGGLFAEDGAVGHYNYTTIREDLAKLFEAAMMKYHFGAELDMAFIYDDDIQPGHTIGWGSRNRLANPLVTERARFVAESILPETNWNSFFRTGIGFESLKSNGASWFDYFDSSTASRLSNPLQSRSSGREIDAARFMLNPHESLSRQRGQPAH